MKKLLLLLTLFAGLLAMPPIAGAKDKDKGKDYDDWAKKAWKETRDDIRELQEEHGRLADTVRRDGASRSVRENVDYIGTDVKRIRDQFEDGRYDMRDLKARIARTNDALNRTRQQMEMDRKYRDNGPGKRRWN
jgi:septal ring factor EnvC (AmiA/AmiB activator)